MDVIGAGPTGRSLRTLNNKNNLAGLYLKKKLDLYKRERSFIISHIDRDRFDTKDFLKQINCVESDNHPAAIQYLGRTKTTPAQPRRAPKATTLVPASTSTSLPLTVQTDPSFISNDNDYSPRYQPKASSATPVHLRTQPMPNIYEHSPSPHRLKRSSTSFFMTVPETEEEGVNASPCTETKAMNRSVSRDTCDLDLSHSRSTLPSLNRKGSLYLQIASAKDNLDFSESSEDSDDESNLDGKKRSRSKISTRRQSFNAWVNEKRKPENGLLPSFVKDFKKKDSKEARRESFMQWLSSRGVNFNRENSLDEISEDAEYTMTSRTADGGLILPEKRFGGKNVMRQTGELMRNIVFMRSYKRLPLDVRIKNFYKKIDKTKNRVDFHL